ncbi:hypothetical protein IMAU30038_02138 [Lactobacillus helveticus]|nr:hypothetical protein [Lactobacillus helveticus]
MLSAIADILYCMKHSGFSSNTDNMQKLFDEMCKEIVIKNINLYGDSNYSYNNASPFYNYWKQNNDENILKYLNKIASSQNIYRILFDTFSFTVNENDEYGYRVDKQLLNRMQLSKLSKLDDFLNKNEGINNDQEKVRDLYQSYLKGEKDFIYYKDEINPQKL